MAKETILKALALAWKPQRAPDLVLPTMPKMKTEIASCGLPAISSQLNRAKITP
jgi:hypothetical protein